MLFEDKYQSSWAFVSLADSGFHHPRTNWSLSRRSNQMTSASARGERSTTGAVPVCLWGHNLGFKSQNTHFRFETYVPYVVDYIIEPERPDIPCICICRTYLEEGLLTQGYSGLTGPPGRSVWLSILSELESNAVQSYSNTLFAIPTCRRNRDQTAWRWDFFITSWPLVLVW